MHHAYNIMQYHTNPIIQTYHTIRYQTYKHHQPHSIIPSMFYNYMFYNTCCILHTDHKGAMRWMMQRYDAILAGVPAMKMKWDNESGTWIEVGDT